MSGVAASADHGVLGTLGVALEGHGGVLAEAAAALGIGARRGRVGREQGRARLADSEHRARGVHQGDRVDVRAGAVGAAGLDLGVLDGDILITWASPAAVSTAAGAVSTAAGAVSTAASAVSESEPQAPRPRLMIPTRAMSVLRMCGLSPCCY